ncbi:substrate-binding periplasmic protein [Thalassotalea fusca]
MKYVLYVLLLVTAFSHASEERKSNINEHYQFSSIEYLVEQEVGRIVIPQIYKNLGITVDITPLPGKHAQHVAATGIKDGEIMRIFTYGEENTNTIRVPTPYYYLETMPFVLEGSDVSITQTTDLKNYRLVKVRGVKHTNNITQGLLDVYEANSTENMLRLLASGQVDVALTNTIDGVLVSKRLGLGKIKPLKYPLATLPLYHYIHKKHQALVTIIDNEIRRLKATGELDILIAEAEKLVIENNGRKP